MAGLDIFPTLPKKEREREISLYIILEDQFLNVCSLRQMTFHIVC